MRISDGSSDVCSSDLAASLAPAAARPCMARAATSIDYMLAGASHRGRQRLLYLQRARVVRAPHHREAVAVTEPVAQRQPLLATAAAHVRSEERRVGKGCVSTCSSRGSP